MTKIRLTKILSMIVAMASAAVLAIQGDYAQAGGVMGAALTSVNLR